MGVAKARTADVALMQRKPRRSVCIDARTMDKTSAFDQLLQAAAVQPEAQRLLFVFAAAGLPDDATPAQRQGFAAGDGGTLEPLVCVDKGLDELSSFAALVTESRARDAAAPWQVVFAAGLAGRSGRAPSADQVETALQTMVQDIRSGKLARFLALDTAGTALQFV